MPGYHSKHTIRTFKSASSLPQSVWDTFRSHPQDSNIMFPHALKSLSQESKGQGVSGQYWITCGSDDGQAIDFILSCTEGPLGSYPIFIFTPLPSEDMDFAWIYPRVLRLVHALRATVPVARVFSVFAPDRIVNIFAGIWSQSTGAKIYAEPYYAAKITYCTPESLSKRRMTIHPQLAYDQRPAVEDDILEAAELCYGFAAESDPFFLTKEQAIEEATLLIRNGQLWVHTAQRPGARTEIASIVAVTRQSDSVSAITKVYTNPKWRRLGCAERLVRLVCKHLLVSKTSVVLYVAHNNPAAAKVYRRVGFLGLGQNDGHVDGVSSWTELGFDRDVVHLGHW